MNLLNYNSRKIAVFLALSFLFSPAIHATSEVAQNPSFLKKCALAYRNGIRMATENAGKLLTIGLLAQARLAEAQVGNQFMINDPIGYDQINPIAAARPDGKIFVLWNNRQDNTWQLRVVSEDGSLLNNETTLAENSSLGQVQPSIAAFNDSSAVAVWLDGKQKNLVKMRTFNADGTANSSDTIIATNGNLGYPYANIFRRMNGNLFLTYNGNLSVVNLIGKEIDQTVGIHPSISLNNDQINQPQSFFGTVELPTGDIVSGYAAASVIQGARYNKTFALQNNIQVLMQGASIPNGWFGAFSNGYLVSTWNGNNGEALGQHFNALNSQSQQNSFYLTFYGGISSAGNSIALFDNGNYAAAFLHSNNGGGPSEIYYSILGYRNTVANSQIVNQAITGNQQNPVAVTLPNGDVFVVWQGQQSGKYQIYGLAIPAATLLAQLPITSVPSSSSSTGAAVTQSADSSQTANIEDFMLKYGGTIGTGFLGVCGVIARYIYKKHKATKYRATKKFYDLLREKLGLSAWDFEVGEGRDYCDMLKMLVARFTKDFNEVNNGALLDLANCDVNQQNAIADTFAKELKNHDMVEATPRKLTCLFGTHVLTKNDAILSEINVRSITAEIIADLQSQTTLYTELIAQCSTGMCVNPIRASNAESLKLNVYRDESFDSSRAQSIEMRQLWHNAEHSSLASTEVSQQYSNNSQSWRPVSQSRIMPPPLPKKPLPNQ